jgi:hypothetical protein
MIVPRLDTLQTREVLHIQQMIRIMIREAITRLLYMTADETIPQTLRQGIMKITVEDTILGTSLLLLQSLYILPWIRGDLTIEGQSRVGGPTLLCTIDPMLDREILAMTFAVIPALREMSLLDFPRIQGRQEILDLWMKVSWSQA